MKTPKQWLDHFADNCTPESYANMETYLLDLISRIQKDAMDTGDHSGDCAKQQNLHSDCTCGLRDRLQAQNETDMA